MLKDHFAGLRRKVEFSHSVDKEHSVKEDKDLLLQDTMTEHMQMLYAKYNRAGFPFKDGNTVRSFKAHWGMYPCVRILRILKKTNIKRERLIVLS